MWNHPSSLISVFFLLCFFFPLRIPFIGITKFLHCKKNFTQRITDKYLLHSILLLLLINCLEFVLVAVLFLTTTFSHVRHWKASIPKQPVSFAQNFATTRTTTVCPATASDHRSPPHTAIGVRPRKLVVKNTQAGNAAPLQHKHRTKDNNRDCLQVTKIRQVTDQVLPRCATMESEQWRVLGSEDSI